MGLSNQFLTLRRKRSWWRCSAAMGLLAALSLPLLMAAVQIHSSFGISWCSLTQEHERAALPNKNANLRQQPNIMKTQPWWNLTIGIITNAETPERFDSLRRLLTSLIAADYSLLKKKKTNIRLHVSMDASTMPEAVEFIHNFEWPYGPKTVQLRVQRAGLVSAVAETWYPATNQEVALLLEDDIEVSPLYLHWVFSALTAASPDHDNRIVGVSLYTPRLVEVSKEGRYRFDSSKLMKATSGDPTLPYLHQLPCSWGAIYYAKQWREFIDYMTARLEMNESANSRSTDVKIPNSLTPGWKGSWKKYMIELMYIKGWYMLYPSYPGQLSFSTNHLAVGEHIKANDRNHKAADYTVPLMQSDDLPRLAEISSRDDPLHVPPVDTLPILSLTNVPYAKLDFLSALQTAGPVYNYSFWSPKEVDAVTVTVDTNYSSDLKAAFPRLKRESVCNDFNAETNRLVSNDNKVTLLISTYDRFDVLKMQIEHYAKSPLVAAILVTWNNQERALPPPMRVNGVSVDFLPQATDSLNSRFYPSMKIHTQAVIIMDDDMKVHVDDIHLLHEAWKDHRDNIVGFCPRKLTTEKAYSLDGPDKWNHPYPLMLTKVMILDKRFLEAYSCSDYMIPLHDKVDSVMNCEHIAMNFLVSHVTNSSAPLFVEPLHFIGDFGHPRYSQRDGVKQRLDDHGDVRTSCYNAFKEHFNVTDDTPYQPKKIQTRLHSDENPLSSEQKELIAQGAAPDSIFVGLELVEMSQESIGSSGEFSTTALCGYDDRGGSVRGAEAWYLVERNYAKGARATSPDTACDFHSEVRISQGQRPLHFYWMAPSEAPMRLSSP